MTNQSASTTPVDASVIIVVRNGAATIRRQLDALAAQVDAPPYEVIVVDNDSDDSTATIVQGWIADGIGAAAGARLIRATDRKSIPYARNTGARAARGTTILWCDADDAVTPGWVAAMRSGIGDGIGCGKILPWRNGRPAPGAMAVGPVPTPYLPHVPGCNWGIGRQLFIDLGGFDESFPSYGCEDVDISWRAGEAGHEIGYIPAGELEYSMSSGTRAARKVFLAAKARMALAIRYPKSQPAPLTMAGLVRDAARDTAQLPLRLLRPVGMPRSRAVKNTVACYGRVAGYWTYAIRRKPPQYIRPQSKLDQESA